jgi:ATP synthase protein I
MSDSGETLEVSSPVSEADSSMQEYYQLQQELLLTTLALGGVIFVAVCFFYTLNVALNYLLGAIVSVVYLRMLGKDVEKLGPQKRKFNKTRLAIFAGLIIVATQLNQLRIIPVFLGFLTYKAALIVYLLRTLIRPTP